MPGLGPAAIEILIADPRWVQNQISLIAGAAGADPIVLNRLSSRILLRLGSLDQVDLGRPAAMWLRDGATDLTMLVPIQRRSRIMDDLGIAADGSAPLVRTSDRDGTIVLTQSTQEGLVEYRALASEGWVALSHTADECRRLIGKAATLPPDGPPLRIHLDPRRLSGRWDRLGLAVESRQIPDRLRLPALSVPGMMLPPVSADTWNALFNDIAGIEIAVSPAGTPGDPESQGRWRVVTTITPTAESSLAAWMAVQRVAVDRLGPALDSPTAWFIAAAYPVWQGQAERLLAAPLSRATASAIQWDGKAVEGATVLSSGADRSGAMAMVEEHGGGLLVIEHAASHSMATAMSDVLTAVLGHPQPATVAGSPGTIHPGATQRLTAGTDNALIHAWHPASASLLALAERGAASVQAPSPSGQSGGLARIRIRFDRLIRPLAVASRGPAVDIPEAEIVVDAVVRDGQLIIQADLPVAAIAAAVGVLELGGKPPAAPTPRR